MNGHYYQVKATRDGKWWEITVDNLDEVTQARRVADIVKNARELIAVTVGVKLEEVTIVRVELIVPGVNDVTGRAERIANTRVAAEMALESAVRHSTMLAKELIAKGVPQRDIAAILGLSHQRVHQLVSAE